MAIPVCKHLLQKDLVDHIEPGDEIWIPHHALIVNSTSGIAFIDRDSTFLKEDPKRSQPSGSSYLYLRVTMSDDELYNIVVEIPPTHRIKQRRIHSSDISNYYSVERVVVKE